MSRPLVDGLAWGLFIGLVGVLAVVVAPFAELEESLGLPWMFNLRGPVRAPAEVVIVAIDEQSADELGLPPKPRAWPRNLHAELIRYLARAGARVIVFDLTFETPSVRPEDDEAMARAVADAGNVLLTESMHRETVMLRGSDGKPAGNAIIEKRILPISALSQPALGVAPFLLLKDSRISAYWTFAGNGDVTPTLPVLAFHTYASNAFADVMALLGKVDPQLTAVSSTSTLPTGQAAPSPARIAILRDALLRDQEMGPRLLRALHGAPELNPTQDRMRQIRALLSLHSSSATRYLNFYGPPRSITTLPYSRVLSAARSADSADAANADAFDFRNKAVFVGYSAATQSGQDRLRDDYRTVYSTTEGLDISGVEIAATAFANLVGDQPLRRLESSWQFAVVAIWGLVVGAVCRSVRPVVALAAVAVMAVAYLWVVYDQFVDAGLWLPSIAPIGIQAPLAVFLGVWLSYRDSSRERANIKRAFGYFLPGNVVDHLARNVGPVTRSNRVVFGACLATDIDKYTTVAEKLDPAKLGELMNEYYAELFVPVERSRGVVVDVVGDAMIAIWAKASSDTEPRMSACEAALAIVEGIDRFNAAPGGRPALATRFGLHAGDMLIGSIGASGHFEYRAVGDIVNTASRIQSLNKLLGTRLLASDTTVAGLEGLATRPLGSFLLAGKSNSVQVVEILGKASDVTAAQSKLCAAFADAISAYIERRWDAASAQFSEILRLEPTDGPAHFYRERCEQYMLSPPDEEWESTVRIEEK